MLRAKIAEERVQVIPNAVDWSVMGPDPSRRNPEHITIVVLSRLVYRKGMSLLRDLLTLIIQKHPDVHFLIIGDGESRAELEQACEQDSMYDRVAFLGAIENSRVPQVTCNKNTLFKICRVVFKIGAAKRRHSVKHKFDG